MPRRVPCLPCKEKHLKCDEVRPTCSRCKVKKIDCRRPTFRTTFINGSEDEFAKDQQWVQTEAKQFCFDMCEPTLPEESSPPSLPKPLSSKRQRTESYSERNSSFSHQVNHDGPHIQQSGGKTVLNMACLGCLHHESAHHDHTQHQPLNPPTPPVDDTLTRPTFEDSSPYQANESQSSWSMEQSHPSFVASSKLDMGVCRQFPLQDYNEACLFKYYIDEVAPWFDIADPDRHFQLVVPIIARSKPHLLNAIFALSARHTTVTTHHSSRRSSSTTPQVSQRPAINYILSCFHPLRSFHSDLPDDDLESLILTAVLLRQVELLDQDMGRSEQWVVNQSGAEAAFLPIVEGFLKSPQFKGLFARSNLAQAAYLMFLRQEIYYSISRRQSSNLSHGILIEDGSFIQEITGHLLQVLHWCWGARSREELSRLIDAQAHLDSTTLVGIQPIYTHPRTPTSFLPTIWYASKTEAYCIQLSKIAQSILLMEGSKFSSSSSGDLAVLPAAAAEVKAGYLILELFAIAEGRGESPHALFHGSLALGLYDGELFGDEEERGELRRRGARLSGMEVWPLKGVTVGKGL